MANKDSVTYTVTVAFLLCLVCSAIVSTAAVSLRPAQEKNKSLDFKSNILAAAGLLEQGVSVEEQFKQVETKLVELESGNYSDALSIEDYDQRKASKDKDLSTDLPDGEDPAKVGRVEKYGKIYIAKADDGSDILILPVRGYGLWSTLYGFLALESDYNTVAGLGFYEHGETPGLGGEVDNPRWKGLWPGKKVRDENGDLSISVIRGSVSADSEGAEYKIDGLSGATLTSQGVNNLVRFWLGEYGYGPLIKNLKNGEA